MEFQCFTHFTFLNNSQILTVPVRVKSTPDFFPIIVLHLTSLRQKVLWHPSMTVVIF